MAQCLQMHPTQKPKRVALAICKTGVKRKSTLLQARRILQKHDVELSYRLAPNMATNAKEETWDI